MKDPICRKKRSWTSFMCSLVIDKNDALCEVEFLRLCCVDTIQSILARFTTATSTRVRYLCTEIFTFYLTLKVSK